MSTSNEEINKKLESILATMATKEDISKQTTDLEQQNQTLREDLNKLGTTVSQNTAKVEKANRGVLRVEERIKDAETKLEEVGKCVEEEGGRDAMMRKAKHVCADCEDTY